MISADQWEADTHVLFGVGRECMLIYVRDHSDMVGTCQIKVFLCYNLQGSMVLQVPLSLAR